MKKRKKNSKKNKANVTDDSGIKDKQIIAYLRTWSTKRNEWKFEKVKQIRLVAVMLDSDKIPDDVFPIFIEYMESAKGKIKATVIDKATHIVEEMEKWSGLTSEEQEKAAKPDTTKYNRARMILQALV